MRISKRRDASTQTASQRVHTRFCRPGRFHVLVHRVTLPVLALFVLLFGAFGTAYAAHELNPELRVRVDALKAEFKREATASENGRERAWVVWEWGNAVAMMEEHIPINLTLMVRSIVTADPNTPVPLRAMRELDRYIYELSLRDDHPKGIGTLSLNAPDASPAESWQTFSVTYTAGSVGMTEGGRLLLARQFTSTAGMPQRDDPAGDNYVSIQSSNPAASFEFTTFPWYGPHGGFRSPIPLLAYRLTGTSLKEGDTVTLLFGDTSQGSRGFQVQTFSNDACGVPIYVNLETNDYFISLPIPTYRVVGKDAFAVHGFAPSIVKTDEGFQVSVRTEDYYYNRASGAIPEYQVWLNGDAYGTIPAGNKAITLMDVALDKPGVYRFTYSNANGSVKGSSNPIWVQDDPPWRLYWGETHGHSGFAEGQGSVDGYLIFGRDDARLDFLTLSEHDIWLDDYEWKVMNEKSREYTVEGTFIAIPGYEWTVQRQRGGHHNVFFRQPGHRRVSSHTAPVLSQLYRQLHAQNEPEDVLIIPHAHQTADWRQSDVELEQLVEVLSGHGTFEWFGRKYLANGHRVGFIGASDDHVGHPGHSGGGGYAGRRSNIGQFGGLAGVIAPEKTTDAIFDALRARHVYATSHSQRIILDAKLNGGVMGTELPYNESVVLEGKVIGTGAIDTIDVVKNGEVVWTQDYALRNGRAWNDVQLDFDSDSDPIFRDTPRGFRIWEGHVEVKGAELVAFSVQEKLNRNADFARVNSANPNRIDFSIATRGLINHLRLNLNGASADTTVEVHLEEKREGGRAPTIVRPNARFPEANVTFVLGDAAKGEAQRDFQVGRYRDRMRLRLVDPAAPMDQTFRYEETAGVMPGDHYYVRVRQLDGALAWSSPFWVGGEPPR